MTVSGSTTRGNSPGGLDITIIGSGVYVAGRGTPGFGTVLPAVLEWARGGGAVRRVRIVGTSPESARDTLHKAARLMELTGVQAEVEGFPREGPRDPVAYRGVLRTTSAPACALVVVPDHLHYEVTKACLEAGLHTLVVKPFTATVAEGRELVSLAERKGLYGAVEFHKRWDRANLMLRDVIRRGEIGEPLYCCVEYSQRKSVPLEAFRSWADRTTILQYLGVHYIDLIRFATGADPRRVMAIGQKKFLLARGMDTHDAIQCLIEWELSDGGRFTQTILTNWIEPEETTAMSDQKIRVVGTGGRFESDQKDRGIRITRDVVGVEEPNPDFCRPYGRPDGHQEWRGYGIDSVRTFLDDASALHAGALGLSDLAGTRPTFAEGLISTAVVEAAHRSLETQRWEPVEPVAGAVAGGS